MSRVIETSITSRGESKQSDRLTVKLHRLVSSEIHEVFLSWAEVELKIVL